MKEGCLCLAKRAHENWGTLTPSSTWNPITAALTFQALKDTTTSVGRPTTLAFSQLSTQVRWKFGTLVWASWNRCCPRSQVDFSQNFRHCIALGKYQIPPFLTASIERLSFLTSAISSEPGTQITSVIFSPIADDTILVGDSLGDITVFKVECPLSRRSPV